jgi:hypothetical protein
MKITIECCDASEIAVLVESLQKRPSRTSVITNTIPERRSQIKRDVADMLEDLNRRLGFKPSDHESNCDTPPTT